MLALGTYSLPLGRAGIWGHKITPHRALSALSIGFGMRCCHQGSLGTGRRLSSVSLQNNDSSEVSINNQFPIMTTRRSSWLHLHN